MTRPTDRDPLGRWSLGRSRWLIRHVEGLSEMERWACYGLAVGAAISAVLLLILRALIQAN